MVAKRLGLVGPVHADDDTESAAATGLYTGKYILNHNVPLGGNLETAGSLQKRIRRRLAKKTEFVRAR